MLIFCQDLVCQYCSLLNALFWLLHFDACACWSSRFPCLHCDAMFKGYIFLQFYCIYVFSTVLKINFRRNTARGKTSQQCEKDNASCIREGSIKMACHTPKPDLLSTKVHSEMPFAYIWLVTFPSTISLHLWLTLHSRACTNLHPWWIPFNSPHWAQGHHSWVPHWNLYVSSVGIEPPLQPLTGKHLALGSANR